MRKTIRNKLKDHNSSLWRHKADRLWAELVRLTWGEKCAICHSMEWIQAHHLIPREMRSHRHEARNGILLCAKHHRFSFELSAHKAPIAFVKWLKTNHNEILIWLLNQEPCHKNITTFKEQITKLQEQIDALRSQQGTNQKALQDHQAQAQASSI